jgi:hypothetical protein
VVALSEESPTQTFKLEQALGTARYDKNNVITMKNTSYYHHHINASSSSSSISY